MKKNFVILLVIVGIFLYAFYWAFIDMERLPKGDLTYESASPKGTYTIKTYIVSGEHTTLRGELIWNKKNKKEKTIFWDYDKYSSHYIEDDEGGAYLDVEKWASDIQWFDDNTVIINNHTLELPNDTYDFRNQ